MYHYSFLITPTETQVISYAKTQAQNSQMEWDELSTVTEACGFTLLALGKT